ncbi:hypothetical protein [Paenibacillus polymyxa]|uniref:hypothetical protein n=1 Tax=Paenibacillus polymyxa TaxID=1406 RepID=UPI002AB55BED|nr:hypothetical protein [Paenibacillus polymyxa]MDY8024381.1 hypothetical protein [Paenibacillus polymyxa]
MQKSPTHRRSSKREAISPYNPPNVKKVTLRRFASGAENLNLEKRSVRLCHGILTFSCLSNPKNPVATAIVRSNPSRSGSLQPP